MTLTSTRQVSVYLLNDPADREQLKVDHAAVGWMVADVVDGHSGVVVREVHMQLGAEPIKIDGRHPNFDDIIVSDLVVVQPMTRAAYNDANPDNPLPED